MKQQYVTITLFDRQYEISGNPDDKPYYDSLVNYIDAKVKELQTNGLVSTQKLAILVALNVVDELFQEREKKEMTIKDIEDNCSRKTAKLNSFIQRLLQHIEDIEKKFKRLDD